MPPQSPSRDRLTSRERPLRIQMYKLCVIDGTVGIIIGTADGIAGGIVGITAAGIARITAGGTARITAATTAAMARITGAGMTPIIRVATTEGVCISYSNDMMSLG
ncbi:hypothetical protein LJR231_005588 [Phyllobacterium sp. LjRoot231]